MHRYPQSILQRTIKNGITFFRVFHIIATCFTYVRNFSCEIISFRMFVLATNQLPLSPVQIQPSPPYYRQASQDDGRKVHVCTLYILTKISA